MLQEIQIIEKWICIYTSYRVDIIYHINERRMQTIIYVPAGSMAILPVGVHGQLGLFAYYQAGFALNNPPSIILETPITLTLELNRSATNQATK